MLLENQKGGIVLNVEMIDKMKTEEIKRMSKFNRFIILVISFFLGIFGIAGMINTLTTKPEVLFQIGIYSFFIAISIALLKEMLK